ncbi:hypothetical protein [Nitrosospira sp. Nsp11]|nr:hypothetical protein [Nitrosospira sp. Nsp11]
MSDSPGFADEFHLAIAQHDHPGAQAGRDVVRRDMIATGPLAIIAGIRS